MDEADFDIGSSSNERRRPRLGKRSRDSDLDESDGYDDAFFESSDAEAPPPTKRRKTSPKKITEYLVEEVEDDEDAEVPVAVEKDTLFSDVDDLFADNLSEDEEPSSESSSSSDSDSSSSDSDSDSSSEEERKKKRKKKTKTTKKKKKKKKKTRRPKEIQPVSVFPNLSARWAPGLAPDIKRIRQVLGVPRPRSECFGCNRGSMNMTAQNFDAWNKLVELFTKNVMWADMVELAQEMEAFYESQIRMKSNKNRPKDKRPLPEWDAATIFAHFTEHHMEPTIQYLFLLRRIRNATHNFIDWQLYEENTGEPDAVRIRVPQQKGDVNRVMVLKQLVDIFDKLYKSNPQKCFLAQKTFQLVASNSGLVNSERMWYVQDVDTVMYSGKGKK